MQPELRAVDAYNARERLVEWVREHGVTTMHTGHGPGALISGQTMVVKTRADNADGRCSCRRRWWRRRSDRPGWPGRPRAGHAFEGRGDAARRARSRREYAGS
jgi:hypothetical protein